MDAFLIISGFGVGVLVGLTGVGGGALMTPLLIFGFGIAPAVAVGTDLMFAAITKANGVWVHARQSSVEWCVVRWLLLGSLPASLLTLLLLGQVDTHTDATQDLMTTTLGLALIASAGALIFRRRLAQSDTGLVHDETGRKTQIATVLTGVVLGALVTLTSVGAGALGAAVLFWLYPRMKAVRVVGTDLAHAVPLATVAGLGHWQLGTVDWVLLGSLLIGSLPGIYIGSRLSAHVPEVWLRLVLASLLSVIGVRLVLFA
ncbi:MAG: sulfite exporter TauE/SafE family protein [Gammaproteobacteria bacterium]|nr:sulfite exporter TauE/SafE family protein [Gammaproteobacteria bacterium]